MNRNFFTNVFQSLQNGDKQIPPILPCPIAFSQVTPIIYVQNSKLVENDKYLLSFCGKNIAIFSKTDSTFKSYKSKHRVLSVDMLDNFIAVHLSCYLVFFNSEFRNVLAFDTTNSSLLDFSVAQDSVICSYLIYQKTLKLVDVYLAQGGYKIEERGEQPMELVYQIVSHNGIALLDDQIYNFEQDGPFSYLLDYRPQYIVGYTRRNGNQSRFTVVRHLISDGDEFLIACNEVCCEIRRNGQLTTVLTLLPSQIIDIFVSFCSQQVTVLFVGAFHVNYIIFDSEVNVISRVQQIELLLFPGEKINSVISSEEQIKLFTNFGRILSNQKIHQQNELFLQYLAQRTIDINLENQPIRKTTKKARKRKDDYQFLLI